MLETAKSLEQEQSRKQTKSCESIINIIKDNLRPAGVADIVAGIGFAAEMLEESLDASVVVTLYKVSAPHLISKEQSWLPSVYAQPVASLGHISDVTAEVKTGVEPSSPTAHT